MYDVNRCHRYGYMVQEIATPFGLAMTVVIGGWSFCFGAVMIGDRRAIPESPLQFSQPPEFYTPSGN